MGRSGMMNPSAAAFTPGCLTTAVQLAAYRSSWEALAARDPSATTYQGHAWLTTWVSHHPAARPRILIGCRGDRLTAAIPLCAYTAGRGAASVHTFRFVADNDSDYCSALVDPDTPGDLGMLWDALLECGDWDLVDLRCVPSASPTAALAREASGRLLLDCRTLDVAPYLDTTVDWRDSVSRNHRSQVSRHRRQLEAAGHLSFDVARSPSDVRTMLEQLSVMHVARWRKRGETSVFQVPAQRAWLHELCRALLQCGDLYLCRLSLDGRPVSIGLYTLSGRRLTNYMISFDEQYHKFGPAHLLVAAAIEDTRRRDLADVHDFGRGSEEYKLRWTHTVQPVERILLGCRSPAGRAAFCWAAQVQPFIWRHYRAATLLRELRRRRQARQHR